MAEKEPGPWEMVERLTLRGGTMKTQPRQYLEGIDSHHLYHSAASDQYVCCPCKPVIVQKEMVL